MIYVFELGSFITLISDTADYGNQGSSWRGTWLSGFKGDPVFGMTLENFMRIWNMVMSFVVNSK
jgi:hypothetical protein